MWLVAGAPALPQSPPAGLWRHPAFGSRAAAGPAPGSGASSGSRCRLGAAAAVAFSAYGASVDGRGGRQRRRAARSEVETLSKVVSQRSGSELGVVAAGNLAAGELVISERALLEVEGAYFADSALSKFERLPDFAQKAVMELHDGSASPSGPKTPLGVVTSSRVPRDVGSASAVVCPTISRFRHSCNPNCEQSWDDDAKEERVYTSTFVREGEELFLPYVELRAPIVERARALWEGHRLRCSCKDCVTPDTEGDRRRIRMRRLNDQLEGLLEDGLDEEDARRGLELVSELLELFDEEALHSKSIREQVCYSAFQLSLKVGDLQQANKWIQKAYQNAMVARGKDHKDTLRLKQYVLEPESHPAYSMAEAPDAASSLIPAVLLLGSMAMLVVLFVK